MYICMYVKKQVSMNLSEECDVIEDTRSNQMDQQHQEMESDFPMNDLLGMGVGLNYLKLKMLRNLLYPLHHLEFKGKKSLFTKNMKLSLQQTCFQ